MAIHREELQLDCGRIGEGLRHVDTANGVQGTCSEIQGVPAGGTPVVMERGLNEKLQRVLYQYVEGLRERLLQRTSRLLIPPFVKKLTTRLGQKHVRR